MKAINLIKNNIFTLLNSGCSNNEIYEAIKELEDLQEYLKISKDCGSCKMQSIQELKQGQDNYNKLWDMYSELKKELGNRTCDGCKHNNNQCVLQTIIYNYDCSMDLSRFCCNKYEAKENK